MLPAVAMVFATAGDTGCRMEVESAGTGGLMTYRLA
jgi:hypothetical protein